MASRTTKRPGLTRTEQLRQAKSAAVVREYARKEETKPPQGETLKKRIPRKAEPKKVDFGKPTMTKTMLARMKHAEKLKEQYEQKKQEEARRQPRRTRAPVAGDARLGTGRTTRGRGPSAVDVEREGGPSRRSQPDRIGRRRSPERAMPPSPISERISELARSMNADIIQAEALADGPIDSIVIPAGAISGNRTTIVSVPQPPSPSPSAALDEARGASQVANRSIQVISETLDEQDAAEVAAVQSRLEDLQQARRDFVIAVANVGGNAVNLAEDAAEDIFRPVSVSPRPRRLSYGLDHPDVVAAREFTKRSIATLREQQQDSRMEEEFKRLAGTRLPTDLQLDIPIEEDIFHGDISWEEDEETGMELPCPSRTRVPLPRREATYQYRPFDPEELERFFDVERYPPSPQRGPPPGREHLHPDLWELDDPWWRPYPQPDMPDLIDFTDPDLL